MQINNYQTQDGQKKREVEIDASAVENLSQTVAQGGRGQEREEKPMAKASAPAGGKKAAAESEDLDAIFSSEDEIPF